MKIQELLEDISQQDLDQVEQFADQLWAKLGVDVEFTRHFLDRVNDERNGKPITVDELIAMFQKEFKTNGIQISNMRRPEAVLKDLLTNINIPFVLKKTGDQKQLVGKTVMRKRNFMSPDPAYVVKELFEPAQASPLEWHKSLNSTYAEGEVEINGHRVSIDITFSNVDDGVVDIEFMVGGKFDLTGRGGVSQVFATVVNAVKEFVADHPKITTLTFTAHEQSRAKMYDTLAKRVSKQVGWHVVPYDEMIADPRLHNNSGEFTFAIQKGAAPAHRQAAQKPQHGEFMPIFYVYAFENPKLPVIKIKAKKSMDAEMWVFKNIPGYENEHPMSIFTIKTPPEGRTDIIDKGEVPPPKPAPAPQDPNSLGAQLRAKLDAPR